MLEQRSFLFIPPKSEEATYLVEYTWRVPLFFASSATCVRGPGLKWFGDADMIALVSSAFPKQISYSDDVPTYIYHQKNLSTWQSASQWTLLDNPVRVEAKNKRQKKSTVGFLLLEWWFFFFLYVLCWPFWTTCILQCVLGLAKSISWNAQVLELTWRDNNTHHLPSRPPKSKEFCLFCLFCCF